MFSRFRACVKLFGDAVSLGADVAQNAAKNTTTISKEVIKEAQTASKQILHSGSDLSLKGLDVIENVGDNVPLAKYPLHTAIMVSRLIVVLGNNVGRKTIDAGAGMGGNTADYLNKMSRLTINSIKDFTITGSKITADTFEDSMKVIDSIYGLSEGPGATASQGPGATASQGPGSTPSQGPEATASQGSGGNPKKGP